MTRQTLFHNVPGPQGPARKTLAENVSWQKLIFLERSGDDSGVEEHHTLPGSMPMPSVPLNVNQLIPESSIWAELEVRFDLQLEGSYSLLWIDREIVLSTFQWPLVAAP
jgi:hypothetical protein